MDKFVIRKPRSEISPAPSSSSGGRQRPRQKTLFQLKGVVVIEELERAVSYLNDPAVTDRDKTLQLVQLGQKRPATELIIKTGIGKVVRKLTKHDDEAIAKAANDVYAFWRADIERKEE